MNYHDTFMRFWIKYLIVRPVKETIKIVEKGHNKIINFLKIKFFRIFGFWYCCTCNKFHSPRVKNYCEIAWEDGSCDPEYLIPSEENII